MLNVDHGYAFKPEELEWVPGACAAVKRVNAAGAIAVIATNQSGIGRGYYARRTWRLSTPRCCASWLPRARGSTGLYFAPHHEDAAEDRYRIADQFGLQAQPRHAASGSGGLRRRPGGRATIGDKPSDMEAARRAGVRGVPHEGGDLEALVVREVALLTGTTVPK